jgi:3-oxoacyl-[acyl-carrier protein] reductase
MIGQSFLATAFPSGKTLYLAAPRTTQLIQESFMYDKAVAVVTGAAGGIGMAVCFRLAAAGYALVLTDLDANAAQASAAQLEETGGFAIALGMDVADPASIEAGFARVRERFGRCDVLVNSAGVATRAAFIDFPLAQWEHVLTVNVTGSMLCGQHAARLMAASGRGGSIVNLASVAGLRASPGRAAYGTSKAAVIALTRQMAVELAAHRIRVNAVAPGPVETALTRKFHTAQARAAFVRGVPSGRYGEVAEVAAAVAFLVSEGASYITGEVLAVDGGLAAAGLMDI